MAVTFDICQLVYVFRMLMAGICGAVIGLERKNRSKEAGIRTHCVVAVGSALMMIISKYGFDDIGGSGDGSRIAAQVVSGIGFLGAGMIFVHKNMITGLTTAAGIWATSGVGMAIGAGQYIVGIASAIIIIIAQIVLHLNFRWIKTPKQKILSIKDVAENNYQEYIMAQLKENGIDMHDVKVEKSTDTGLRSYTFLIEMPPTLNEDRILTMIDYKCSIKSA